MCKHVNESPTGLICFRTTLTGKQVLHIELVYRDPATGVDNGPIFYYWRDATAEDMHSFSVPHRFVKWESPRAKRNKRGAL